MKKIATIVCIMTLFMYNIVLAANLGTLSYWYSDKSEIGRWSVASVKVYANKLNANGSFYFGQGLSTASSQWSSALGITVNSSVSVAYSSAPIKYYGGTKAEVNATGAITVKTGTNGLTIHTSSLEGTWTKGGATYNGRKISAARGYVLDNSRTTDQYKKTCLHELGHALGWFGHSANNSDIMFSQGSSVTALTTRDKRHLAQVY